MEGVHLLQLARGRHSAVCTFVRAEFARLAMPAQCLVD